MLQQLKSRLNRARKSIPKREQEVCVRLRKARDLVRFTQEEFAEQIGITRARLASYEEARVAIRYDLALRLCRQFIISEKWLATGQGFTRQYLDLLSEPLSYRIPVDAPYGEVYDKYLADLYERIQKDQGENLRIKIDAGSNVEFVLNLFRYLFELWTELPKSHNLPASFSPALGAFLMNQGEDFVQFVLATGRLPEAGELPGLTIPGVTSTKKIRRK